MNTRLREGAVPHFIQVQELVPPGQQLMAVIRDHAPLEEPIVVSIDDESQYLGVLARTLGKSHLEFWSSRTGSTDPSDYPATADSPH